jgi:glycosyltransferase involved in cell wall biosynthesis
MSKKTINILINFAPVKDGGGQNVGLNFLSALDHIDIQDYFFYFIVAKNSAIHQFLIYKNYNYLSIFPQNPLLRILFELFLSRRILKKNKIEIIYSYFGYGLFLCGIPQVTGAADSNLLYPEINFWEGYRGLILLKKLIDKYRIIGLKKSKGIIFENKSMENRFHEFFNIRKLTTTIYPSINLNYFQKVYYLPDSIQSTKKGLFLCGWQLNKNVMLIPKIAFFIKKHKIKFHFVLTAPKDSSYLYKKFIHLVNEYSVADYITITGRVNKEELQNLYQKIDIVFLLSKLESFSNNIIEAWSYKRVLLITDAPWARSICENAAVYVDRNNPEHIARNIVRLLSDKHLYKEIVNNGIEMLKGYPTIEEKTLKELEFIKRVYESN